MMTQWIEFYVLSPKKIGHTNQFKFGMGWRIDIYSTKYSKA